MNGKKPPQGGSRRLPQRQIPGDRRKSAAGELPAIRKYLRTQCSANALVTRTLLTDLFDLPPHEAARAQELLLAEGMLVRCAELGNAIVRAAILPPETPA